MIRRPRAAFAAALAALAAATLAPSALAQAWPSKPLHIIVPYPPGGSSDIIARAISKPLSEALKQPVVVENKPGANGNTGTDFVAKSAPDGYTMVLCDVGALAITASVYSKLPFDPSKDLRGVTMLAYSPHLLVVHPSVPANNLAELVQLARKEPGKLSYATSGVGTVLHLAMELIKQQGQFFATHVPYRGGAQIATDVIGGQVDLAMLVSVSAAPFVQGGKLKAIAVTGAKRLDILPNVPTVAETPGFKGYDVVAWTGLFAPAKTPAPVIERLNHELNAVLALPEVRATLQKQGAIAGSGSTPDFGRFVKAEQQRYEKAVKTAGIKE